MTIFATTPSQTVGPYFAIGLPWDAGPNAVPDGTPGTILLTGTVYDGHGEAVPDAMIEIWGADGEGRYADLYGHGGPSGVEAFIGFGRAGTDDGGAYELRTLKPGPVPGLEGAIQAPHLAMSVFARGMLHRLVTRVYFADEAAANATDPLLLRVPADRLDTLLAQPTDDGYRFDVRLQGPGETVFLDV